MSESNDSTRERLLQAAERLFALQGFDATSVRDITAAAECNVASVNYHFGGKDKLYLEVFRRRLSDLRDRRVSSLDRVVKKSGADLSLDAVLRTFASNFLEPMLDPDEGRILMELMAREMTDPHLPPDLLRGEMIGPVQNALAAALRSARPDLDENAASACVFSVVAQLVHVLHMQRMTADRGEHFTAMGLDMHHLVDHITRFSAGGVAHLAEGAPS